MPMAHLAVNPSDVINSCDPGPALLVVADEDMTASFESWNFQWHSLIKLQGEAKHVKE